jgi:hypothetical protein
VRLRARTALMVAACAVVGVLVAVAVRPGSPLPPVTAGSAQTVFSIDADPDTPGVQSTVVVTGDTFVVDVVVESWASPPAAEQWEAYQVKVAYTPAALSAAPPVWENLVTTFPNGADCTTFITDDGNLVTCGDDGLPPVTHAMTVPKPLIRMHFQCVSTGTSMLVLEGGALGTFILDALGEEVSGVLNGATITCTDVAETVPVGTPTAATPADEPASGDEGMPEVGAFIGPPHVGSGDSVAADGRGEVVAPALAALGLGFALLFGGVAALRYRRHQTGYLDVCDRQRR